MEEQNTNDEISELEEWFLAFAQSVLYSMFLWSIQGELTRDSSPWESK